MDVLRRLRFAGRPRTGDRSLPRAEIVDAAVIRGAEERDIAEIARIEREAFSDAWSERDFRAVMNGEGTIFLVAALADDSVIGYIILLSVLDESEVLNIAVDQAYRGQSVGRNLVDAGLEAVESRGSRATYLEVRASNAAAIRLYRSRGFEEVSRRLGYYRNPVEDALVLRRALK